MTESAIATPDSQEEPISAAESPGTRQYSDEHVAAILANSFRYSQGNDALQNYFLTFIAERFGLSFQNVDWAKAVEHGGDISSRIVGKKALHGGGYKTFNGRPPEKNLARATRNLRDYAVNLQRFLAEHETSNPGGIASESTSQDYRWLVQKDQRWDGAEMIIVDRGLVGRERGPSGGSPITDSFLSYFIYYGLLARDTGSEEYNAAFKAATEAYSVSSAPETERLLGEVAKVYLEHHPLDKTKLTEEMIYPSRAREG